MKAHPEAACWLCKGRGRRRHCPEKEGAERRHYSQVVSQDTSLRGPQVLHQLRIRMFIAHHGGAHLLQGKPQELLSWLLGRRSQSPSSSPCPSSSFSSSASSSFPLPAGPEEAIGKRETALKVSGGGAQAKRGAGWVLPGFLNSACWHFQARRHQPCFLCIAIIWRMKKMKNTCPHENLHTGM